MRCFFVSNLSQQVCKGKKVNHKIRLVPGTVNKHHYIIVGSQTWRSIHLEWSIGHVLPTSCCLSSSSSTISALNDFVSNSVASSRCVFVKIDSDLVNRCRLCIVIYYFPIFVAF